MPEPLALAYEERGTGPVLLLVHGFPFDRTMWLAQLKALASLRRAVAVDLRGHGLSADRDPAGYSMDLFADDLAATLDEIGAERADVCGLSMGGYVAFAFWRRHRARIRSLIFCCTKAEADGAEARERREETATLVRESGMGALWERLGPTLFGEDASEERQATVRAMVERVPAAVAAADSLAMRDRPDSTPDLTSIDVPVLWIAGDRDRLAPPEQARATAAKIRDARFVSIPGAGHLAPVEKPEQVNDAIAEFLRSVS